MRLTAIKLAGFKSFVDPTTLRLDADLVGIVGPNGCGKSNVIDAVRWVTGESSAKQLRGGSLEDVIFNGSKARKPIGRAAIELHFDNSDGQLGGQYARFSEISVRREMSRDGGSRYTINGSRARRRDVVDLFLGTGLGGRSNYAVIEQGAVNRLVEARPGDIRQVLEEAAGISRYRERRRETENRIRRTRENLDRLNDLIGEVTQRLAVLSRQARNAQKYKALKQEERRMRAQLLALRWRAFDADVRQARQVLDQREQAMAEAVSKQRQAREQRTSHDQTRQTAAEACQRHQAAFYDAQGEANRIAQALAHDQRMREMRQRERDELNERQSRLADSRARDMAEIERMAQDIAGADAELAAAGEKRDAVHAQLAAADTAIEQAEKQQDAYNTGQTPVGRLDAERTRRHYLAQQVERTQRTLDERHREAQQLGEDDDVQALQTLDEAIGVLTGRIEETQLRVDEHAKLLETLRHEHDDLTRQADDTRTHRAEQQARLASERAMQQAVLREDDDQLRDWLQRQGHAEADSVARHVTAPTQWQTAVEAALAGWLSGFAVAQLPTAHDAPTDWPGDTLTLIESGPVQQGSDDTVLAGLPSLASGLTAPPGILAMAQQVFVAESLPQALSARSRLHAGQMIVTTDGVCIGPASLRTPAARSEASGVLERERRIKTLADDCAALDTQLTELDGSLTMLDQRRQETETERRTLEKTLAEQHKALSGKQAQRQGAHERLEQRRRRRSELAAELERLQQQRAHDETELQTLDERIAALTEQAEAWTRGRDEAQRQLARARHQRQQHRTALDEVQSRVRRIEQDLVAARSRREHLTGRVADVDKTQAQVSERLAALDAPDDHAADAAVPTQADLDVIEDRLLSTETALRTARAQLQDAESQVEHAARAVMQADAAVEQAREAAQQAQINVETASARRDGLVEQLDELGEQAQALLRDVEAQATVADWQRKLETVERRIARLGEINLAAISEHDAEAEREQYLSEQHADLIAALETLENAIARIDRETRSRFRETYDQVNERFGSMFPTLFGGGRAGLELTEDDLLSTGVRVMARPPGKRNASIQMLSGGEKALTAVALLFALFELNPAPFCMLDEIDAPLDDANVARFCELVRTMSAHVQFIVITHNKLTMELAEQLHGVTMAEPGVSRLVSVNIEQALDMAG